MWETMFRQESWLKEARREKKDKVIYDKSKITTRQGVSQAQEGGSFTANCNVIIGRNSQLIFLFTLFLLLLTECGARSFYANFQGVMGCFNRGAKQKKKAKMLLQI